MSVLETTRATRLAMLAGLTIADALLDGCKVRLSKTIIPEGDEIDVDDIVAPEYTGYADQEPGLGDAHRDVTTGALVVHLECLDFLASAPTPPDEFVGDDIWGYAVLDADEEEVIGVVRFDVPAPIRAPGEGLTAEPILRWGV